jgi:exodeoxyribonuclease VII large subunit
LVHGVFIVVFLSYNDNLLRFIFTEFLAMRLEIPILSVSQLNKQVKSYLENELGLVRVEGEVSNLSRPSSGHFYFTLKDRDAQLRCVFFKNRHQQDTHKFLMDGQHMVACGRLSLYEARGDYQLIVEEVTHAGLGALFQLYEALKSKLAAEGLFDKERKKPLPTIPQTIGIISSPSGAALQDMLSTLARRFPVAKIIIYPSEVQGVSAPKQLISALNRAEEERRCEVLIIARGGGSIEDLWAFNDEQLARRIAACSIPIISGVGHETDFTISDFVADYRAETPTAAAILVAPDCLELINCINQLSQRLQTAQLRILNTFALKLQHLMDKITSPQKAIASCWQNLDYLERQIEVLINGRVQQKKHQFANLMATLHAVSPLATLHRGYAIASKNRKVLYTTNELRIGDVIQVRLSNGHVDCTINQIEPL